MLSFLVSASASSLNIGAMLCCLADLFRFLISNAHGALIWLLVALILLQLLGFDLRTHCDFCVQLLPKFIN